MRPASQRALFVLALLGAVALAVTFSGNASKPEGQPTWTVLVDQNGKILVDGHAISLEALRASLDRANAEGRRPFVTVRGIGEQDDKSMDVVVKVFEVVSQRADTKVAYVGAIS